MKVLLTGANGFVGSRVLSRLRHAGFPTAVLLRPASSRHLIHSLLPDAEIRAGDVQDSASLDAALAGVTHVIHCAGKTKALHAAEFDAVNVQGTRNLVKAMNRQSPVLRRLVLLSSLAAVGPAVAAMPAREDDAPRPVSAYGRSKLRSEQLVRELSQCPFGIFRAPGVYGPGDRDFLQLFRTVRSRIQPLFGGGRQSLSLVFVDDLADVLVAGLTAPLGSERLFHVAHPQVVTAAELGREVARQLDIRPLPLYLPVALLTVAALAGEAISRITRRPAILSLERRRELQAPGWVCDVSRLQRWLGRSCPTGLSEGLARTLAWYRQHGWL